MTAPTEPEILLADEPTGNLDSRTGEAVLELIRRPNTARGLTVALAMHSAQAARCAQRTVALHDGCIVRG